MYRPTNREKVRNPQGIKSQWCLCDRAKVLPGKVCTICGSKCYSKREKYRKRDLIQDVE